MQIDSEELKRGSKRNFFSSKLSQFHKAVELITLQNLIPIVQIMKFHFFTENALNDQSYRKTEFDGEQIS